MVDVDLGIDHLQGLEMIGQGGFSTVYAATDVRFSRQVAVKVLAPLNDEADRRRFDRECQVMGRLSSHPNVVTVHDAGFTPGRRPYLIMELVEGGSLAKQLSMRGRLPWTEAVEAIVPVCSALERAHETGILHRDIKPENILLEPDGTPKVTDFGIAYLRDSTGHTSTNITASWLHAPPETFENARDERSDLYSVASTLYTLIAGRAPFWQEGDESLSPLIGRVINQPPPFLPAGLAPPALDDVINRSLAKDPTGRPQSMTELRQRLQAIGDGTVAAPSHGPEPASGSTPASDPQQLSTGHRPYADPTGGTWPSSQPVQGLGSFPSTGGGPGTASTMPPGWYHAQGDPPGTQRYWDGLQWQGPPQGTSGSHTGTGPGPSGLQPTTYGRRAGAYLIDGALYVVGFFVLGVALQLTAADGADWPVSASLVATLVAALWNNGFRQGQQGQSLGKQAVGIGLVSNRTGRPPGGATGVLRTVILLAMGTVTCGVATVLSLLWPLWDQRSARFPDHWLQLAVVERPQHR